MTDMDKMMIEPCPFCGGEATVEKPGPANWRCWSVRCSNCPKPLQPLMSVSEKRAEAISAWNTRAYNPDDRLREALELARPFVFDRFQMANGAGYANTANTLSDILGKIDAALSPLPQGDG